MTHQVHPTAFASAATTKSIPVANVALRRSTKLFQNLRSTRETELAESLPIHIVCQFMGNSEAVAKKHYLRVTDEHFADAVTMAYKLAWQPSATLGNAGQPKMETAGIAEENPPLHTYTHEQIPPRGVEPRFSD